MNTEIDDQLRRTVAMYNEIAANAEAEIARLQTEKEAATNAATALTSLMTSADTSKPAPVANDEAQKTLTTPYINGKAAYRKNSKNDISLSIAGRRAEIARKLLDNSTTGRLVSTLLACMPEELNALSDKEIHAASTMLGGSTKTLSTIRTHIYAGVKGKLYIKPEKREGYSGFYVSPSL